MAYSFVWTKEAACDLRALDLVLVKRVVRKILWLERQANPLLRARVLRQPAIGDVRFRIGDYRLIGILKESAREIVIVKIGHRRKVYL